VKWQHIGAFVGV